jgi:hypothetical protein
MPLRHPVAQALMGSTSVLWSLPLRDTDAAYRHNVGMTRMGDLLGPDPVLLPGDPAAEAELAASENPSIVAAAHPTASVAWAALAEDALADDKAVAAYAYARTGYHRGLDQLRRNGWKGFGPVPYRHEPNRGFLRCVAALARAADSIGETDEYQRCLDLLDDCDPAARSELGLS